MPFLKGFRVTNVFYGEDYALPDLLFDFDERNTLILMPNGTGKTYLISCFFLTILTPESEQIRSVDEIFSGCTGTSHILSCFYEENRTIFSGFCTKKKHAREYYHWVLTLEGSFNANQIAFSRGDSIIDYDEFPYTMRSLYGKNIAFFSREESLPFIESLKKQGIYQEEWKLMNAFNRFLEGDLPVKDIIPSSVDRISDTMLFPMIEDQLRSEGIDSAALMRDLSELHYPSGCYDTKHKLSLIEAHLESCVSIREEYRRQQRSLKELAMYLNTIHRLFVSDYEDKRKLIEKKRRELYDLEIKLADRNDFEKRMEISSLDKHMLRIEASEEHLMRTMEERQNTGSLLYEELSALLSETPVLEKGNVTPVFMGTSDISGGESPELLAEHRIRVLKDRFDENQTRKEYLLKEYTKLRMQEELGSYFQEKYRKMGMINRYQKIEYEKVRLTKAMKRNERSLSIQIALLRKLIVRVEAIKKELTENVMESERLSDQKAALKDYLDYLELICTLEGHLPVIFIVDNLETKIHRMHIEMEQARNQSEELDALLIALTKDGNWRPPDPVVFLSKSLRERGFSDFQTGSDWSNAKKNTNPLLYYSIVTDKAKELEQVLSTFPLSELPVIPITILSKKEARELNESGEFQSIVNMKPRRILSLYERLLSRTFRQDPSSQNNEKNLPEIVGEMKREFEETRKQNEKNMEKTQKQLDEIHRFSRQFGNNPEEAMIDIKKKIEAVQKEGDRIGIRQSEYRKKKEMCRVRIRELEEEKVSLLATFQTLVQEEGLWSFFSEGIQQFFGITLKDFSLFIENLRHRISDSEEEIKQVDRIIGEISEKIERPIVTLLTLSDEKAMGIQKPDILRSHEIIAGIRDQEQRIRNVSIEMALLRNKKRLIVERKNELLSTFPSQQPDPEDRAFSSIEEVRNDIQFLIREIEQKQNEIRCLSEKNVETTYHIEHQEQFLRRIQVPEKLYIKGMVEFFIKPDYISLWAEKESDYSRLTNEMKETGDRFETAWKAVDVYVRENLPSFDGSIAYELPAIGSTDDSGLKALLTRIRGKIEEVETDRNCYYRSLSQIADRVVSTMERVDELLKEIALFSRPSTDVGPLLEFAIDKINPEEQREAFVRSIMRGISERRSDKNERPFYFPLRVLWEILHDHKIEIKIHKPPFSHTREGKRSWNEIEKWSTGEKMAMYLVIYTMFFSWWKEKTGRSNDKSVFVLDHLFGPINSESLLEVPMRLLLLNRFQLIGFTSYSEPFLFKYFPKWIGLSPLEKEGFKLFLPFRIER
jgi:hypothetical protein